MYENNKDIGWKKKNSSSNGSYDDSLIKNQISILDKKIEDKQNELDVSINKIKMIAHRGFSSQAPENTIPSYELAGMNNYWGAECDILETSDGHFVLMHDDTVNRTTNGTGSVANMTLEQIKALTVDINVNYNNVKVPTLEEYLICCKKYAMVPIIEIKAMKNIQNFVNIIRNYGYEDSCVVISFNNDSLKQLRSLSSVIKIQTLTFVSIEECLQYNFDIDMAYEQVTKDFIQTAHENGLKVSAWTVNDNTIMNNLINMNIDYIITDGLTLPNQVNVSNLEKEIEKIYSIIESLSSDTGGDNSDVPSSTISIDNVILGQLDSKDKTLVYPLTYKAVTDTRAYYDMKIMVDGNFDFEIETSDEVCVTLHPYDVDGKYGAQVSWLPNGTVVAPTSDVSFYIAYFKFADESTIAGNEDTIKSTVKIHKISK